MNKMIGIVLDGGGPMMTPASTCCSTTFAVVNSSPTWEMQADLATPSVSY